MKDLIKSHSSHPLVRTAILLCTMPHLRPRLHKILQANLGVADAVQSSLSIFVGYLVLSQTPQTKEELVTAIDVHSAAIRGMGQAMARSGRSRTFGSPTGIRLEYPDGVHTTSFSGKSLISSAGCLTNASQLYLMAHRLAWCVRNSVVN